MSDALNKFLMPQEQKAKRRESLGGSDANTIMSGDPDRLVELWEEKLGRGKEKETTLQMLMGTVTEELNAAWYAHNTDDHVVERGAVAYADLGFPAHATLDGRCKSGAAIWEAKHTSGYDFQAKDKRSALLLAEYYMPQLQHNMLVTGSHRAVLSVFFDNNRWEYVEIEADPFYQDLLKERERAFWQCVVEKKRPFGQEPVKAVPIVAATKVVNMEETSVANEWGNFAAQWLETKRAADNHADAVSKLKGLIDSDVATAKGFGVIARKDKRGAVRISAL